MTTSTTPLQPVAFLSHGSPTLALEHGPWHEALKTWASGLSGVRAIVMASAHWETPGGFAVTSSPHPGLLYDFSGFPPPLYQVTYPAPGDPVLAARIVDLLRGSGLKADPDPRRPLDHGAWVPLRALFPGADLPVVQVSLPFSRTPGLLAQAGKALAPLRAEGVLLLGSGGLVHNLRQLDWDGGSTPEPWAKGFEDWMMSGLAAKDAGQLFQASSLAPGFALAAPTPEHLDPVYFAFGAAGDAVPATFYEGWQLGNLSLRAMAWS